jgi:hypothetical protein
MPSKPFEQHRASTVFLRVPTADWPLVITGVRREFRAAQGNVPQLWTVPLPTLCVCYRKRRAAGDYDHRLMVLEDVRQERLCEISEAGLRDAGYDGTREEAYAAFRRDWMIREKRKFAPTRKVMVFRVRKVEKQDVATAAFSLLNFLYGDFLNGSVAVV